MSDAIDGLEAQPIDVSDPAFREAVANVDAALLEWFATLSPFERLARRRSRGPATSPVGAPVAVRAR